MYTYKCLSTQSEKKRVNFHAPSECLSIDKRKGEQPIKFVLFFIAIDISMFLSNSFRHCNETKVFDGFLVERPLTTLISSRNLYIYLFVSLTCNQGHNF